jgi:hypothetical protein
MAGFFNVIRFAGHTTYAIVKVAQFLKHTFYDRDLNKGFIDFSIAANSTSAAALQLHMAACPDLHQSSANELLLNSQTMLAAYYLSRDFTNYTKQNNQEADVCDKRERRESMIAK